MIWDKPVTQDGKQMQVWTQQSCDSEALKLWWVRAVYLWAPALGTTSASAVAAFSDPGIDRSVRAKASSSSEGGI